MERSDRSAPPSWQEALDAGVKALKEAGIQEAELDAWYLFSDSFQVDRVHFLMDRNRAMYQGTFEKGWPRFAERIKERAERIPLQHILGSQEFMGLSFFVNPHVLIPRQDTETLVEEVLRDVTDRNARILDMCTGSGCIALSLAVLGKYKSVTAADISPEALKVAERNAKRLFLIQKGVLRSQSNTVSKEPFRAEFSIRAAGEEKRGAIGLNSFNGFGGRTFEAPGPEAPAEMGETLEERRLVLSESDLFSGLPDGPFDVIVSNPPYIPSAAVDSLEPEVRDHEPRLALDGSADGLHFYRLLAARCREHLNPGGRVYFEIGCDQGEAVKNLLAENGYGRIEIVKDAPGRDRVAKAVLKEP